MSAAVIVLQRIWASEAAASAGPVAMEAQAAARPAAPEMAFYRKYTEGILRRYLRMSMEAGKVPSLLGKEMFRGKVTQYQVKSFEDVVIFVHDVEKCLGKLDKLQQELITRIALQEYTQGEAAGMVGLGLRTVGRRYAESLDRLTEIFLEVKILEPMLACQEGMACR